MGMGAQDEKRCTWPHLVQGQLEDPPLRRPENSAVVMEPSWLGNPPGLPLPRLHHPLTAPTKSIEVGAHQAGGVQRGLVSTPRPRARSLSEATQ